MLRRTMFWKEATEKQRKRKIKILPRKTVQATTTTTDEYACSPAGHFKSVWPWGGSTVVLIDEQSLL